MLFEIGTIFMLHRVGPYEHGRIIYNEHMKISPEELKEVIRWAQRRNAVFVSLDELHETLNSQKKSKYKFVAFTLDDGYSDNIQNAYPVFKSLNIPFCIYVTNSFPNYTSNLWWYALEELVIKNSALTIGGNKIDNSTADRKNENFMRLRGEILTKHFSEPVAFLKRSGELIFDLENEKRNKCLSWEDIASLSRDSLVTIGAHTINHFPLARLPLDQAELEIRASKEEIESKIGKSVHHFAFPFGTTSEAGKREYALARNIGFRTAVTTVPGHVYRNSDPCGLNRIFLGPKNSPHNFVNWSLRKKIKEDFKHLVSYYRAN